MFHNDLSTLWDTGLQPLNNKKIKIPIEYTTPGPNGTQHQVKLCTTTTTALGLKFDGGVIIAADTIVSYGSMARYHNVNRVCKLNEYTLLAGGNNYADFQHLKSRLERRMIIEQVENQMNMRPGELFTWLTRLQNTYRNKMNPFNLDLLIAGIGSDNEPFLGQVDLRGRAHTANEIATGFGQHVVLPMLREHENTGLLLQYDEALKLVHKCLELLYYRDTRAGPYYTVGICTREECVISSRIRVDEDWTIAPMVDGY